MYIPVSSFPKMENTFESNCTVLCLQVNTFLVMLTTGLSENGSDQLIMTLFTIYPSFCTQTADPNPFQDTHCHCALNVELYGVLYSLL